MWVNGLDKYGTPLVAAMVPDGDIRDPDNRTNADGDENLISNIEYMSRVLANLQNGTGLAMAAGTQEYKSDIKFHGAGAGLGDAFERLILYLNKMIFRGLLVPSLVCDEGQKSGSYALGQSHFDVYSMMLDGIYADLTEVLLEQLVRPLIEMNFGAQKDYGSFPQREQNEKHLHHVQTKMCLPLTKVEDLQAKGDKAAVKYDLYYRENGDDDDDAKETA